MLKKQLIIFSIGLVSATLFFLTFVAVLGIILSEFIPRAISNSLNLIVGALIIFFGVKMLLKKNQNLDI